MAGLMIWVVIGLPFLVIGGASGFLYANRPRVLECVVHDFVTRDSEGKTLSCEKTLLVKIRAGQDAEFDAQGFSLITSGGNEIKADHVQVLEPGKVGMRDPKDAFSKESRALVSFTVSDDVSKTAKLRLKYKFYPSIAIPESRKQTHVVFQGN